MSIEINLSLPMDSREGNFCTCANSQAHQARSRVTHGRLMCPAAGPDRPLEGKSGKEGEHRERHVTTSPAGGSMQEANVHSSGGVPVNPAAGRASVHLKKCARFLDGAVLIRFRCLGGWAVHLNKRARFLDEAVLVGGGFVG